MPQPALRSSALVPLLLAAAATAIGDDNCACTPYHRGVAAGARFSSVAADCCATDNSDMHNRERYCVDP